MNAVATLLFFPKFPIVCYPPYLPRPLCRRYSFTATCRRTTPKRSTGAPFHKKPSSSTSSWPTLSDVAPQIVPATIHTIPSRKKLPSHYHSRSGLSLVLLEGVACNRARDGVSMGQPATAGLLVERISANRLLVRTHVAKRPVPNTQNALS